MQKFAAKGLARAAIYISKNISAWYIEHLSSKDLVVAQIKVDQQDVLVVSAYMDIKNRTLETPEIIGVLEFAKVRGLGLIIGMDSNCHSTLFGPKQNQRGYLFDELIANNNLTIENIGNSPTYESRGKKTCIDVTLTRGLRRTIKDWRVDRTYNWSDHNYINFSLQTEKITIPKIWQWHKADWVTFKCEMKKLENKLPTVLNQDCCEIMLNKLYQCLNRSMKKAIPKTKPKLVDKNNLWWNDKLKHLRKAVGKSYEAYQKEPSEEKGNIFRARQKTYKKECEKARLHSWRDLQTNINNISDMNKFRKIVQGSEQVTLGTLTKESGEQTKPGKDTIEYLSQIHFNKATPLKATPNKPDRIHKSMVDNYNDNIITEEKVVAAFKAFKVKKSPGTDGIHPLILQQLPEETITYITKLYKVCVLLGYTPTRWKECKIVFIPKPGKGSYQTAKAWRPISLTNYLLKGLEKLCCWHMDEKIELNPIHTRQHGFRTDRNTDTSISNVGAAPPGQLWKFCMT